MKTTIPVLFEDLGGRICCEKHIGYQAQHTLERRPNAKRIETDLTVWERLTDREIALLPLMLNVPDEQSLCEACRWETAR